MTRSHRAVVVVLGWWLALAAVLAHASSDYRAVFPKIAGVQVGAADWGDPNHREIVARQHLTLVGLWRDYRAVDHASGASMTIPDIIGDVRRRAERHGNRDILIFKYSNVGLSPSTADNVAKRDQWDKLHAERGPRGDWWARNTSGQNLSFWSGQWATNITRFVRVDARGNTYPEWKMERDYALFFANGTFDGVFLDDFHFRPRVRADWNGDGRDDDPNDPTVRSWIREGHMRAVQRIRQLDSRLHVIANVDGNPGSGEGMLTEREYRGQVGALSEALIGEHFSVEEWGGWDGMMRKYRTTLANAKDGLTIFHAIGGARDYAQMRYGLTSALMDDGYYAYNSSNSYREAVWYDEFDVELGRAIDPPPTSPWKQGVYMRRFERGMAIVNPKGNGTQVLEIPAGYRRIAGRQDPLVNSGEIADRVTLRARDGIVLQSTGAAVSRPNPPRLIIQTPTEGG